MERFVAELDEERPLFRILPISGSLDDGFVVTENHTRWQLVGRALQMLPFAAFGGTLLGIALIHVGPVSWLLFSPFLVGFGVFALRRLTRRYFHFDLRARRLEVRRKAGRFTLWRKRLPLAGFDHVHFMAFRSKGPTRHLVSLRGNMKLVNLLDSQRRDDSVNFANWLDRALGLPVKGVPENTPHPAP
ncbi:MAG: hypothetical protein QM755_20170 [Luteolibacter sp.]